MSTLGAPPSSDDAIIPEIVQKILIALFTSLTAFGLVLSHLIVITKYRLWHTNPILEKIPKIIDSPISQALATGIAFVAVLPFRNDLYMIWLVVIAIIYDNVQSVSNSTLLEQGSDRLLREYLFLYNTIIIGSLVITSNRKSEFYSPLVFLWSLLLLKFIERFVNNISADKAYGIKNTNLVADYMETKHIESRMTGQQIIANPEKMEGYPYLVIGEDYKACVANPPTYNLSFKKDDVEKDDGVVTLDKVWNCNNQLLNKDIDRDGKIKDVCLSFALFKLIRRRFFGFRAIESQEPKTKEFVFRGLLCHDGNDKERVFRVIKMELGFLRDFFYTRYPVVFAMGFPVFNVVILILMCIISIWISAKAFHMKKHHSEEMNYLIVGKTNVDYRITNGLLIIIIATEVFEVLSYVFSDWMKVIIICGHIRSKAGAKTSSFYKMLCLLCKPKFSVSLKNTIGQYSLLTNYDRGVVKWVGNNFVYYATCGTGTSKISRAMKEDKEIVVPVEVKEAIYDALKLKEDLIYSTFKMKEVIIYDTFKMRMSDTNVDRLSALLISNKDLISNEVFEALKQSVSFHTPLLTIMVWHIATSMCGMCPRKDGPIIEEDSCFTNCLPSCLTDCFTKKKLEDQEIHQSVASSLSKYCAYLVVFSPELLPPSTTVNSAHRIFDEIVKETSDFFKERTGTTKSKYTKMLDYNDKERNGVIDMGVRLGKQLIEGIHNDETRWKVMADFWCGMILYLAPSARASDHLKKLASGGEFITHLWVLLYHAGIVFNTSNDSEDIEV